MDALRHMALGCCVISTVAGMIRVFWPENSFAPVINAVLALYIITAGLQMIRGTNWQDLATEVYRLSSGTGQTTEDFSDYSRELGLSASAETIRNVLQQAGIQAVVQLRNETCQVTLLHASDRSQAQTILETSCGTLPYEIIAGGENP